MMAKINANKKKKAIGMLIAGTSVTEVANETGIKRPTVQYWFTGLSKTKNQLKVIKTKKRIKRAYTKRVKVQGDVLRCGTDKEKRAVLMQLLVQDLFNK
jgi:transposase-like protein